MLYIYGTTTMRKITKKREFEISKSECGWDVGESIQFEVGSVQVEYYKRRPNWERKTLERKELKLFGWWWDPAEVLVAVSWSFFLYVDLVFEISTFICSISSLRLVTSSLPLATARSSPFVGTIATRLALAVTILLPLFLALLPFLNTQLVLLNAFLTECLLFCDLKAGRNFIVQADLV